MPGLLHTFLIEPKLKYPYLLQNVITNNISALSGVARGKANAKFKFTAISSYYLLFEISLRIFLTSLQFATINSKYFFLPSV